MQEVKTRTKETETSAGGKKGLRREERGQEVKTRTKEIETRAGGKNND